MAESRLHSWLDIRAQICCEGNRFAGHVRDACSSSLLLCLFSAFDESIVAYVRRTQGSLIGEATAERIKQEVGAAYPQKEIRQIDVRGRNLAEGIPRSFTLDSNEILEALQEPLSMIVQAVKSALEQCPPELASDIADTGMVLTGGGALLRDLDILLAEETGLPVIIAEDPLTCVARGGGKALELMDEAGNAHLLDI